MKVKEIPSLFRTHTSFYRFATVGCSCFLIEYVIFTLLNILIGDKYYTLSTLTVTGIFIANSFSYIVSSLLSFTFNRIWTFKSKGKTSLQLNKFAFLFAFNLVISNCLIHLLKDHTPLQPQAGKLVSSLSISVWNYFINKYIVFKK